MLEIKGEKKILITPISEEDLKDIHIGDIIYLNGDLTTCRDVAHRRLVEEGRELPVDVRNAAILHAGPIIRPLENSRFEMVSVGPTTSMRMEKFEKEFVRVWDRTRSTPAEIIERSTVFFRRETRWLQRQRWKRLWRHSGRILACRKRFGTAM